MQDQHEHRAVLPSASLLVNLPRSKYAPRIHFDEAGAGGAAAAGADGGAAQAGGDAGAAGGAAAADGGAAAAGAVDGGQAAQAYRPEGLPDHLAGVSDKETIDKLFKTVDGFRRTNAERGEVPEKPDGYTFEASDKLKPFVNNFDKDPVYNKAREIAREAGMTNKQFGTFIPKLLEHFVEGGLVESPIDPKAMLRTLAPAVMASATDAEKEAAGGRVVTDNIAWVDQMKADKTMPADAADYLVAQAADNPHAHALIGWLRGAREERRPALTGAAAGGVTKEQLDARIADPRNDPNDVKFNRQFAEDTRQMFIKASGG